MCIESELSTAGSGIDARQKSGLGGAGPAVYAGGPPLLRVLVSGARVDAASCSA